MDFSAEFCYVFAMKHDLWIIFKDDIQKIFDHFSSMFDLKILFYSAEGEIIKVGLNRPNSLYCQLIQDKLFGINACLNIDREGREKAKTLGKTVDYFCHAGIKDILTPVLSDGNVLGYIGFGQFRQSGGVFPKVMTEWIRKGRSPAELTAAFLQLPYYSKEKETDIKELFSFLFNYIVSQQMIAAKGDLILHKALSYIHAHIDGAIRLSDVAAAVGRSRSTISHLFKGKLRMGFKKTVMNIRFDKAEEYFRIAPHLNIKEVAARVGYDDSLQFSRIFKKHRKLSPRQFIREMDRG
jgi:AraC-like DNA-binding protein